MAARPRVIAGHPVSWPSTPVSWPGAPVSWPAQAGHP